MFYYNKSLDYYNMPVFISLEGNIGAGKSTFLAHLEKRLQGSTDFAFLREPVHIWDTIRDGSGNTILKKFYQEPEKYAFAFQVMTYTTRYQELKRILQEHPECKVIICERSLEADKQIFAKMLHDDGVMDDVMYSIYETYFTMYEGAFQMDGIIYVRAEPEVCYERIEKRSRDGENKISSDYLKNCHAYHESWLNHCKTPLLSLNVNDDDNDENVKSWLNKTYDFIQMLCE